MQIENLSWFPGHMTKTKRMIVAEIGHMDAVCEIVDARIPLSSRNPDVDEMTADKPRLIVLNRVDPVSYTHLGLAWLGREAEVFWLFAGAQLVLGCFNLLPVRPLDGGRLLWLAAAWRHGPFLSLIHI